MKAGHGGNIRRLAEVSGRAPEDIIDFSANMNPLGPPPWLRRVISRNVESLVHYPDPDCTRLLEAASRRYKVPPAEVIVGNGSTEILYVLPAAVAARRAVVPGPAYVDYSRAALLAGLEVETFVLSEEGGFALDTEALEARLGPHTLVFLGQPSNPAGCITAPGLLRSIAGRHPETIFAIDEAFAGFVENYDTLATDRPPNVIVLSSLTKLYAIPGLRLGLGFAAPDIAARIREKLLPWSVNTLAQAVGVTALGDVDYAVRTRGATRQLREDLARGLEKLSRLHVFPGTANYLLMRIDDGGADGLDAIRLADLLLKGDGIAVRVCSDYEGLDERFFRVAVRSADDNERLVDALSRVLGGVASPRPGKRRAARLMLQGTCSNAGKSILTVALSRILLQDGYDVAPFKAQNMALNSFVTAAGGEMGRAQVVQAQACRLEPDVRMNPVLLKPSSDTGSQVIVMGKPVGNMAVGEYTRYKAKAFETVKDAFDSLASEHEVMLIEGAGSPAEVNLKHHDITNMRMAAYAKSPVLLVGDIDRGGVFASFVGTMEVLDEWERRLVAGFVVNRFRGDSSLLGPAFEYTLDFTGRPVLGLVPYIHDLGLPEEDSVSFKAGGLGGRTPAREDSVEIALVDLQHISNFTDMDPFRIEPDVHLRVVRNAGELGTPDAVILPGSKNVIGDLAFLMGNGLAGRIMELADSGGTEIVGLCGGFQMLGRRIADPLGIESSSRVINGLGLLPMETVLAEEKTLKRTTAVHPGSNLKVRGYEIHHGRTAPSSGDLRAAFTRPDGAVIGYEHPGRNVWGTYLHGVFDDDAFRRWFIDRLRRRKGLEEAGGLPAVYDIEPAIDRLAAVVREGLRMGEIYKLMGLG